MKYFADKKGFYGEFGGAFIPEMLYSNIKELQYSYKKIASEEGFKKEIRRKDLSKTRRLKSHWGA